MNIESLIMNIEPYEYRIAIPRVCQSTSAWLLLNTGGILHTKI